MSTHPNPKQSLLQAFRTLPDPRIHRRKRHALHDILIIAITSLLCGAEHFTDMADFGRAKDDWFKTFLELPNGIPSHDTFRRVFALLNPRAFSECFLRWTEGLRRAIAGELVALDGKTLRRSLAAGQSPIHLVNAWAAQNRLVLGQIKVADKSNEITAIPELLRALELAGCVVTLDAMGCQKEIAREIREADADYVLALKGNHGTLYQEVKAFLNDAVQRQEKHLAQHQTVEKDHGRIETRRYWITAQLGWLADHPQWEGLQSVGLVEALREVKGQVTVERRYYLTSLPAMAKPFAEAVRGHWSVENQLHWVLDVGLNEDQSRIRTGYAAENLAALRKMALNLLQQDTQLQRGIRGKQKNAGWDHRYLLSLLKL
jgi:predicted transposase YbfD/YdcC